nr:transposase [Okeania hirsuta]
MVWSRDLPAAPSSVTVIKDSAHRYFLSFVVEIQPEILPQTDNSVGIDLGISTFATFSDGRKVDAPKPLKKRIKKLRKLNKSLSHKTKGSKRYEKARARMAKFHAKLKDTRIDFLHKLSTKIIRENQTVVLEDLNVSGMIKNRNPPPPLPGGEQEGWVSDARLENIQDFCRRKSRKIWSRFQSN